jgi:precorrin-3B synthase
VLPAAPSRPDRLDRCPGVLRLTEGADGWLARVRLPGGLVSGAQLAGLAQLAGELGDERLELTSRGNVQLRGLPVDCSDALVERLTALGLAPSATHERVRNITASPLAGIDGGRDLTDLVHALDAAICADPRLAQLPGRFLFALDDGRGDVAGDADLAAVVRGDTAQVESVTVAVGETAVALVRAAHAFLDERAEQGGSAWHVDELVDRRLRVRARLDAAMPRPANAFRFATARPAAATAPARDRPPARRPIGRVGSALVVGVPLGRLTVEQARWLAGCGQRLRITPWRRVVIPDADPGLRPAAVGLVTDPDSPWLTVSACAGQPRCRQALADVQADAAAALHRFPGRRVHWSGCDRRCGRSADVEVDVVATSEGYRVSGV